jgi:hypothetical protein
MKRTNTFAYCEQSSIMAEKVCWYWAEWSFHAIGFFNEADTLESSSMLIYSFQEQSIYTQMICHEATYIKRSRGLMRAFYRSIENGILIK